jgi:transaldolase
VTKVQRDRIGELKIIGQSIWLDYISRSLIETGKLKSMIEAGIRGVTSNPTIFEKAVGSGDDYDSFISELARSGKSTFEVYDELTVKDIQDAADLFIPVFENTGGLDGYVSLEVNPELASRAVNTVEEGKRLVRKVGRPNLMLKVPATDESFEAIEALIGEGINVNVTLIFSHKQYLQSADAYIRGLKRYISEGGDPAKVSSVASVFVSRIDSVVDKILDEIEGDRLKRESLKGKAAVANSRVIYDSYVDILRSEDFNKLSRNGARAQRVLWASTGTKNPSYSNVKYVTELIAKGTVNTLPMATLESFLMSGAEANAFTSDCKESRDVIEDLKGLGIDISDVCRDLLDKGIDAFKGSFASLLSSIEKKAGEICCNTKT